MRCPKCHYISYDSVDRCRNCGYELRLAVDQESVELPIRTGDEAIGPLADFPLGEAVVNRATELTPVPAPLQPPRSVRAARSAPAPRRASVDLPLFKDRAPDPEGSVDALRAAPLDKLRAEPLVSAPVTPRAPLSVRKAKPVSVRPAPVVAPTLALERTEAEPVPAPAAEVAAEDAARPAGVGRRLGAGVIDGVVLASIDTAVVYFTLEICGFSLAEIVLLPPVPLLSFLLLLDGGYLSAFTAAGGQTIGKMATGIKVVSAGAADRVRPRDAVLRALGYIISALPVGIGFLPALFGAEGRAVHDRLADTRVIRA
jgi:uncharacterized RDD family membrane protein YckC